MLPLVATAQDTAPEPDGASAVETPADDAPTKGAAQETPVEADSAERNDAARELPSEEDNAETKDAAQEPQSEADSAETKPEDSDSTKPATADEQEPNDKIVAEFTQSLAQWKNQIKVQERTIENEATTDDQLKDIPNLLEALREEIVDARAQVQPKLKDAQDRLAELGAPPKDGAPKESEEIAAQRKRLEEEVADIDGKLKQADILLVRAGQLIDAANDKRRERFTESLFQPAPNLYTTILPAAVESLPGHLKRFTKAGLEWFARAWDRGPFILFLIFAAPLVIYFGLRRFITRTAARLDAKRIAPEEPSPQQCGRWALRKTIRNVLPFWLALLVFYLLVTGAGLADPTREGFLMRASLAAGWALFLIFVTGHSLVPENDAWQLIPTTNAFAWRITGLLWALVGVWFIDQLVNFADTVIYTPYQLAMARAGFFSLVYAALIASILVVIWNGPVTRKATFSGWRGWLFSFMALQVGVVLFAALLGYEPLARFIGNHLVSTAGVLWIMYLLHLAAESISSVSVISGRAIDDDLDEDEDMGAPAMLTIRIIVSLLLDIAILLVGITALLLLWRSDWVEVRGWIQTAFFGFQFGNLRISLQSLFIALGVFAVGLLITRFVQRWFTGRVFAGRRTDSGLNDSARIGIGYIGFAIAALAGISYLGVDFSNLAIIAGALSVGIGFGLQSIFNNFVSGLILLVERPIKIGDYIQVGNQEGTVKKISVRSTEIETIHRQSVIVPNATLITDPVVNWMHLDKSCRVDIPIGVDYGTDVELLRSTLLGVAESYRGVLKSPPPVVHFAGFGDSSLDFELRVFLRDVRERIKSMSELRFAILAALRDAGISIPFPQRDLHIKDGLPGGENDDSAEANPTSSGRPSAKQRRP